MKTAKRFLRLLRQYWVEILVVFSVVFFPWGWQWLKKVLFEHNLQIPTLFYISCEIIYDLAAVLALYYLKFWRPFIDGLWKEFGVLRKEEGKWAYVVSPFWILKKIFSFFGILKSKMGEIQPDFPKVRFWFWINRVTALVQPGVTLFIVFLYSDLPLWVAVPVYAFLFADLVSTILIIQGLGRKLNKAEDRRKGLNVVIRLATSNDLEGILKVDLEQYGEISERVTATREMMDSRIKVSNIDYDGWFWVAENKGKIVGILSLLPTKMGINDFKSWEVATDNGMLISSFSLEGEYVYGVALTLSKEAEGLGVSDMLIAIGGAKIISLHKKGAVFSGRMPGYYLHRDIMTPREYYNARISKDGKKVALDPQIRMYEEEMGFRRVRLVENAFAGDVESCGFGVLFLAENPFYKFPFPKLWGWVFGKIALNRRLLSLVMKIA